jgi:hypothetical protein
MGNSDYRHFPVIPNAERDAERVSNELDKRGFSVIKKINADRREMLEAITDFENALAVTGGIGLFYYAGKAAYLDGEDIMFPVDTIENRKEAKIEGGVNFTKLEAEVAAKTIRKVVSNGRAVIYSASKGEFAKDGPRGQNSPFTKAFLQSLTYTDDELGDFFRRILLEMEVANKDEEGIFKQTPYIEDRRTTKFYFNKPETDKSIGVLKILVFDSCRDNPFKLDIAGR